MASNVTVQSVLGKISQDHLECSICSYRYKQPKVLDCLHSFCLKCLQELRQQQEPESTKLKCPLCRRDTKLKGNNVAALPNNFTLGALVEEFTMQEQLLDEGQGSEIKCQSCDEENEAVSRCMTCDSFLCLDCDKGHRRMAALKTHDVNTLDQLRSGEISYKSKLREEVPKCGKHPDQNVSIYCNTCEQLACTTCSILDHAKHSLSGQMEAWKKSKQEVDKLIAKAEKNKTSWSAALEKVENIRKTLNSTFNNTTEKISRKADKDIDRIREEEQKLKQDAQKIYKDRLKMLDKVQASNSKEISLAGFKLDEMKQLANQASCHEILDLKQKLLHNLGEMVKKQPKTASDKLSFMDFEESENPLAMGKLLLQDGHKPELKAQAAKPARPKAPQVKVNWQKKTEINKFGDKKTEFKFACDVAVFSNNEVVIVDTACENLISFVPKTPKTPKTPQSPAVSKELKIDGLHSPRRVAVNNDDQLIVLIAGSTIKILNREYQILQSFKPGSYKLPERTPTCLAVDATNEILVGYGMENETSLHKPDGSFLGWTATPGVGYYMHMTADHDRNLIYTKSSEKKLILNRFRYSDQDVLFGELTGKAYQHCYLRGVCCDSDGNIYAAVGSEEDETYEIHRFSPDGKHLGHVIKGCHHVHGITFTPQGDLVAAAQNWVYVYRRV